MRALAFCFMIRLLSHYCSLYDRDEDAEVELDDVWFAYPSRPNNMVLKVLIHLQLRVCSTLLVAKLILYALCLRRFRE